MDAKQNNASNVVCHNIPPVFDCESRILILGSFPSVKSREMEFFYGHPQNRFWKVLSAIFAQAEPITIEEKKSFLLEHRIALWDVIGSCTITGSADSSIRAAVPNDLSVILTTAGVRQIFVNGKTAEKIYNQYQLAQTERRAVCLPSTSPANAAKSLAQLIQDWQIIKTATES